MAGVTRTLVTFGDWLNDRKWRFHEAGMMAIWNELKRIANTTVVGPPTTYDFNLITQAAPDFTVSPGITANTPASMGPLSGQATPTGTALLPPTQSI